MSAAKQIPIAEGLFTWPSNDPRLLGSKCGDCGVVTFPAQKSCPACSGQNVETIELERRGTLWTWTIQGFMPNRPPYTGPETPETFKPFGVGYVELPGPGPRGEPAQVQRSFEASHRHGDGARRREVRRR